jgi:hypothetical protein
MMIRRTTISIKRTHGLGNLIMLLPVIDRLLENGVAVHLVTRPEWVEAVSCGRPALQCGTSPCVDTIDLDGATFDKRPSAHRTIEFAHILGISGPFPLPRLTVPEAWSVPFQEYDGAVVFSPEAGHPARALAPAKVRELSMLLEAETGSVVLTGLQQQLQLPCRIDMRGKLSLPELLGLLKQARSVVCFDSGMLHLALACSVPALAVFSGIDPAFRIFPEQRARVIQANLNCCPCNKAETCEGRYPCLNEITPAQIMEEFSMLEKVRQREIVRLEVNAWTN